MAQVNAGNIQVNAKGDIFSATAAGSPTTLSVGADGQVLTADSTQASGLNWSTSPGPGEVIQYVYTSRSDRVTLNSNIPIDDTIPQSGEGVQVLTLAITPHSASNLLVIKFYGFVGPNGMLTAPVIALFQDATANALAATSGSVVFWGGNNTDLGTAVLSHTMAAGTTSSTTFKIRIGMLPGLFGYLNGNNVSRNFGGRASSVLEIWEIGV